MKVQVRFNKTADRKEINQAYTVKSLLHFFRILLKARKEKASAVHVFFDNVTN